MPRTILIGAGIAALGVFYYFANPGQITLPQCPFYYLTQLYCPGCGTQRGIHALLHGRISMAFDFNPLMIFGLVYTVIEAMIWTVNRRWRRISALSSHRYTPLIVLMVIIVFWIMRNIPYAPFTFLAP